MQRVLEQDLAGLIAFLERLDGEPIAVTERIEHELRHAVDDPRCSRDKQITIARFLESIGAPLPLMHPAAIALEQSLATEQVRAELVRLSQATVRFSEQKAGKRAALHVLNGTRPHSFSPFVLQQHADVDALLERLSRQYGVDAVATIDDAQYWQRWRTAGAFSQERIHLALCGGFGISLIPAAVIFMIALSLGLHLKAPPLALAVWPCLSYMLLCSDLHRRFVDAAGFITIQSGLSFLPVLALYFVDSQLFYAGVGMLVALTPVLGGRPHFMNLAAMILAAGITWFVQSVPIVISPLTIGIFAGVFLSQIRTLDRRVLRMWEVLVSVLIFLLTCVVLKPKVDGAAEIQAIATPLHWQVDGHVQCTDVNQNPVMVPAYRIPDDGMVWIGDQRHVQLIRCPARSPTSEDDD